MGGKWIHEATQREVPKMQDFKYLESIVQESECVREVKQESPGRIEWIEKGFMCNL